VRRGISVCPLSHEGSTQAGRAVAASGEALSGARHEGTGRGCRGGPQGATGDPMWFWIPSGALVGGAGSRLSVGHRDVYSAARVILQQTAEGPLHPGTVHQARQHYQVAMRSRRCRSRLCVLIPRSACVRVLGGYPRGPAWLWGRGRGREDGERPWRGAARRGTANGAAACGPRRQQPGEG